MLADLRVLVVVGVRLNELSDEDSTRWDLASGAIRQEVDALGDFCHFISIPLLDPHVLLAKWEETFCESD